MSAITPQQPPAPHPRQPDPSGALYGDVPLSVPRRCKDSPYVTILSRLDGVTAYTMRRANDSEDVTVQCKIDTRNEYLLMVGTTLHYDKSNNNEARIRCAYAPLARVIALQQPSTDLDRCIVDHANNNPLDNTAANLHWVTLSFKLNVQRRPPSSGFVGVNSS